MWSIEETNTLRRGTIISFYSNFAIVSDDVDKSETLCSLRGRFKLSKIKPLVGDKVEYIRDHDRGRIESILPRISVIEKPKISNVNQAVTVFSISKPDVPYSIVDRTIASVLRSIPNVLVVLNKVDITDESRLEEFKRIYRIHDLHLVSAYTGMGIDELRSKLRDKISVFAGPSGVGKSSLINQIIGSNLKTGVISDKTNFGKHTTTAASLLKIPEGGFIVDTPGFTTIEFTNIAPEEVQKLFLEIFSASKECAFDDCLHEFEPGCKVKELVEKGEIPNSRYKNYLSILNEVKSQKIGDVKFDKKR